MAHLLLHCGIKTFSSVHFSAGLVQGARERMKKSIMIIDSDEDQCRAFCKLLEKGHYKATPQYSTENLEVHIKNSGCQAIFWDIDTIPADNRMVRDLTLKFPEIYFFCLSKQPFHPELQDAICYHIYACLNRPVDPDELFYWLRSIEVNETKSSKPTTN